jgi:Histidine kinase-like ATPase domain
MNTMAPTRPPELYLRRIRLTTGPTAAAQARRHVLAAVRAWDIPVDPDAAVLLTSELVTNAIRNEPGQTVTLALSCSRDQLRVDVHDTSPFLPVQVDAPADAEAGRGLMLVATLSAEWGFYRTPAGKAVYFALAFESDASPDGGRGPQGVHTWGLWSRQAPAGSQSPPNGASVPSPRSPRRNGAQRRLTGNVGPGVDAELLEDVGDVSPDGPSR